MIIDQLVVALKLDPKQFDEGQKKAVNALRELEKATARAGEKIRVSAGERAIRWADAIEHPVAAVRRHFEHISREGPSSIDRLTRSTSELGQAAEGAAAGFGALLAPGMLVGLAAIAGSVGLMAEGYRKAAQVSRSTFAVGLGAGIAGMRTSRYSAIMEAFSGMPGGGPQAGQEAGNWLQNMRQSQLRGEISGQGLSSLAMGLAFAGYHGNIFASPSRILNQLATQWHAERLSPAEAAARGSYIGLSSLLTRLMTQTGSFTVAEHRFLQKHEEVTGKQVHSAARVIQSMSDLSMAVKAQMRALFLNNTAVGLLTSSVKALTSLLGGVTPGGSLSSSPSGPSHSANLAALQGLSYGSLSGAQASSLWNLIRGWFGGSNTQGMVDYLKQRGLSSAQIAGIMANIQAESGGNPAKIGDHGTSGGLFQEHGPRFEAMKKALGPNWRKDIHGQLAFALAEMHRMDPGYFSGHASAQERAREWTRRFERPRAANLASMHRAALAGAMVSHISNTNVSVGDVHVHVPAGTDGHAQGNAAADALHRRLVSQVNTGLQ